MHSKCNRESEVGAKKQRCCRPSHSLLAENGYIRESNVMGMYHQSVHQRHSPRFAQVLGMNTIKFALLHTLFPSTKVHLRFPSLEAKAFKSWPPWIHNWGPWKHEKKFVTKIVNITKVNRNIPVTSISYFYLIVYISWRSINCDAIKSTVSTCSLQILQHISTQPGRIAYRLIPSFCNSFSTCFQLKSQCS